MNAWRGAAGPLVCEGVERRKGGGREQSFPRRSHRDRATVQDLKGAGDGGCGTFRPRSRVCLRGCAGDEAVGGPLQVHRRDDPRRAVLPGARQHTPRLAAARGPPCHVPQTEDAGSSVLSFGRTGCGPRPAGRGGTSARTLLATVQCPDFDRLVRLRTAHRSIKRVTSLTDGRARPW